MNLNRVMTGLLLIVGLSVSSSSYASTNFIETTFEEAKQKAAREGKMLVLDFYVSWCAPCRFMEKTTFQDPNVSSMLNEKFVPLKINIDDFDGYALKEHFGVKVLPTFLIFNNEGKVIERVEETLAPSRMIALLEKSLVNHVPTVRPANVSPSERTSKAVVDEAPVGKYKIQLGLFDSYSKTLEAYNQLSATIKEPVIILHDMKGSNIVYRVLVGNFKNTSDAHIYLSDLKENHDLDGHIYI